VFGIGAKGGAYLWDFLSGGQKRTRTARTEKTQPPAPSMGQDAVVMHESVSCHSRNLVPVSNLREWRITCVVARHATDSDYEYKQYPRIRIPMALSVTTRSRTLLFFSYRDSTPRPRRRNTINVAQYVVDDDENDERQGLIASSSSSSKAGASSSTHVAIDVHGQDTLPPKWSVSPIFPIRPTPPIDRPISPAPCVLTYFAQGRHFRPGRRHTQ